MCVACVGTHPRISFYWSDNAYQETAYTLLLLLHICFLLVSYVCCPVTCLGSSLGVTFNPWQWHQECNIEGTDAAPCGVVFFVMLQCIRNGDNCCMLDCTLDFTHFCTPMPGNISRWSVVFTCIAYGLLVTMKLLRRGHRRFSGKASVVEKPVVYPYHTANFDRGCYVKLRCSLVCASVYCLPVNEPINNACFILLFILNAVSSHSLTHWCIVLEGTARNGWCLQPSLAAVYARLDDSIVCLAPFSPVHNSVVIFISLQCRYLKRVLENAESPVGCFRRIGHFLGHLWCALKFLQLCCEVRFGAAPLKTHIAVFEPRGIYNLSPLYLLIPRWLSCSHLTNLGKFGDMRSNS